jgi:hypothetical protein
LMTWDGERCLAAAVGASQLHMATTLGVLLEAKPSQYVDDLPS